MSDVELSNSDNSTQEQKYSQPWMPAFIAALSVSPSVTNAAQKAKRERQYCYQCRDMDEYFRAKWDEALEACWDALEQAAYTRATYGTVEAVYSQGLPVGVKVIYSDRLAEVLLKGNRAKTYRETHAIEMSGKLQTENLNGLTTEQLAAIVQKGIEAESGNDLQGKSGGGTVAAD